VSAPISAGDSIPTAPVARERMPFALALVLTLLVPVPPAAAQEPQRPEDSVQLGVFDGELPTAGIEGERGAGIAEALRTRNYDRAETLLLEAAEAQPENAAVLRLLGGLLFLRGRPLNAAVALKKAEKLAPLDERSRFTLVMSYIALGHRDWARRELGSLIEADPRSALYAYWSARLDYDDQQYAAAAKGFERAIELDPRLMKAWDNLGLDYDALGRFDEAVRAFEEAIRLNDEQKPRSPWPPLNLGLLLTRLDKLDEAEARFRASLACDPGFAVAHYQLGLVLEKKGRLGEAVLELEESARLDPASSEAQYALARLYRRGGDKEKADRAQQRFEQIKEEQRLRKAGQGPR
jgi:tetratricopeptide (TPR) repeat protein